MFVRTNDVICQFGQTTVCLCLNHAIFFLFLNLEDWVTIVSLIPELIVSCSCPNLLCLLNRGNNLGQIKEFHIQARTDGIRGNTKTLCD